MKNCVGCAENFYNGNNPYGIQKCWSLESAQLIEHYQISKNAPMHKRSNYRKVTEHNCMNVKGFVFLTPESFRADAKED